MRWRAPGYDLCLTSISLESAVKARSIRTQTGDILRTLVHNADRDLSRGRLRDLLVSDHGAYITLRALPFQVSRPLTSRATVAPLHSHTSSGPHLASLLHDDHLPTCTLSILHGGQILSFSPRRCVNVPITPRAILICVTVHVEDTQNS